jgi:hypothetical protein
MEQITKGRLVTEIVVGLFIVAGIGGVAYGVYSYHKNEQERARYRRAIESQVIGLASKGEGVLYGNAAQEFLNDINMNYTIPKGLVLKFEEDDKNQIKIRGINTDPLVEKSSIEIGTVKLGTLENYLSHKH